MIGFIGHVMYFFTQGRIQDCFPPGCCKFSEQSGGAGGRAPGGGCKGAASPCVGKFCISELNSRDLVHTFYQHYIVRPMPEILMELSSGHQDYIK